MDNFPAYSCVNLIILDPALELRNIRLIFISESNMNHHPFSPF